MGPLIPIVVVGGLAYLIFGKKKAEAAYGPADQADFPGGASGQLYSAYIAAMTGQLQPIAYGILADDLRAHGFEYEADQVAEYAMKMGPTWVNQGWGPRAYHIAQGDEGYPLPSRGVISWNDAAGRHCYWSDAIEGGTMVCGEIPLALGAPATQGRRRRL
jgi:hypothetical protein